MSIIDVQDDYFTATEHIISQHLLYMKGHNQNNINNIVNTKDKNNN